jgi:hypothetical protein
MAPKAAPIAIPNSRVTKINPRSMPQEHPAHGADADEIHELLRLLLLPADHETMTRRGP